MFDLSIRDQAVHGSSPVLDRSDESILDGTGSARRAPKRVIRSALLTVAVTGVLVCVALTARIATFPEEESLEGYDIVVAVTYTVLGYAIIWRAAANRVGWCLLVGGLFGGVSSTAAAFQSDSAFFAWLYAWSPWLTYALLPVALLLFPDGRLPSANWRWALWLGLAGLAVPAIGLAVAAAIAPHLLTELGAPVAPVVRWAMVMTGMGVLATALASIISIVALAKRWRRSEGETRQQLKWLAFGGGCTFIAVVMVASGQPWSWIVASMAVPVCATVAILRYRLYDIDVLINRSLVYAVISLILLAICSACIVVLASSTLAVTEVGALIVVVVGLVLVMNPLRMVAQRWVDRVLRGHRNDPDVAIARLGRTIVSTSDARHLLSAVVDDIARSMRLPYVAVSIEGSGGSTLTASIGRSQLLPERSFSMTYQGVGVGSLVVAQRSVSESLTSREVALLGDLASHVGIAAHMVRLTMEVQRSRERLRRDLEEERRRFRHDLHDSLGPMLAGLVMQAGASRARVRGHTGREDASLESLERGLRRCIDEVRGLINGLHRPSVLDEVGLLRAIQETARGFDGSHIRMDVPDAALPELPAAVEVAAFRIVTEALTNVARHSGARHASAFIAVEGNILQMRVEDDGRGIDASALHGEGLLSMRERAVELGGTCVVEQMPDGGTVVAADLPIRSGI